ncbi:questin oxidase family protein [Ferrimonas balearica]|uniref:questin oxidase family protein n=1 Tax=Ferrimonas balearica TaxID=44012 RepID=UPI001C9970F4|nr:questin oxidase family protein [Ferrimonas balearica]MBY5990927.1 questin oxidase family protein [Ferrimonas balearica]
MLKDNAATATHWIEASHRFEPEYGRGLTNHLPMVLGALSMLGAPESTLNAAYQRGCRHLVAKEEGRGAGHDEYGAQVARFTQVIAEQGTEAVVRRHLNDWLAGLSSAAFHCLIRLHFALCANSSAEVAHALAYWATRHTPLPTPQPYPEADLDGQLHSARVLGQRLGLHEAGLISTRIETLVAHPQGAALTGVPAELTLETILPRVLSWFDASGDFTLLHGVTGLQALVGLMPLIDEPERALAHYWQAYVAALAVAPGAVVPEEPLAVVAPDWRHWQVQTLGLTDSHDIKVIYSLIRLWQATAHPGIPGVIARRLAEG